MRCKRPSTEGSTLITPRPFVFPGTCLVVDTEHWFVLKDREATQTWPRERCVNTCFMMFARGLREKTLIGVEAPRSDTNGACEAEVTVTSERHAQAEKEKLLVMMMTRC